MTGVVLVFEWGEVLFKSGVAFKRIRYLIIGLTDLKMAFRIHVHRDLTGSDLKNIASYLKDGSTSAAPADGAIIDFNKFCCIGESTF